MLRLIFSFLFGLGVSLLVIYKLFNKNSQRSSQNNENSSAYKNKKLKFPPEPEVKIEKDKFLNILRNMNKTN